MGWSVTGTLVFSGSIGASMTLLLVCLLDAGDPRHACGCRINLSVVGPLCSVIIRKNEFAPGRTAKRPHDTHDSAS